MTGLLKLFGKKPSPPASSSPANTAVHYNPTGMLRGKQHVLCWFVCRTSEKDFTQSQKRSLIKGVDESKEWLCNQAEAYGHNLEFTPTTCYGFDHTLFMDEVPADLHDQNIASFQHRLAQRVKWNSQGDLFYSIYMRRGVSNIVSLVFINSPSRSFARKAPLYETMKTFSTAFIYKQKSEVGSYASVITHELLHMHGAMDLYAEDGKYGELYSNAMRLYPTDIMLHSQMPLCEATVGPFRAYQVGWHLPEVTSDCNRWPTLFQKFKRD
jgi:hypothetical protein